MTKRWMILTALLSPLAAHAASVTTPTVIAINTPAAFSITAPTQGYTPAPVPDQDVSYRPNVDDGSPKLSGTLQDPRVELRSGAGYTPHSNFSEELEMRSRGPTPGLVPSLTIKFPLN